jgi:regulator of replication initiation timing
MADKGLDVTYEEFIDDVRELVGLVRSLYEDHNNTKKIVDELRQSNAAFRIENGIRDIRLENNDEDWRKLGRRVDDLAESIVRRDENDSPVNQPTTKGVRLE